jgi:hypothetical protein
VGKEAMTSGDVAKLDIKSAFIMGKDKKNTIHENIYREQEVSHSSERVFGIFFAGVFVCIGIFPLVSGGGVHWTWLILGGLLFGVALIFPRLLMPFNRIWIRIGFLLHKVFSPLVTGFIFFGVITPLGKIMQVLKKTPLELEFESELKTYWVSRQPPGPRPEKMRRQF